MGRLAELLGARGPEELERGSCKEAPPHHADLFHGGLRNQRMAIAAYCDTCPVVRQCLNFAISLGSEATRGAVWGGKTPAERAAISRSPARRNAPPVRGTSRYRGVSWSSRDNVWHAYLRMGAKTQFLGAFPGTEAGEEQAARRWDRAAIEYRGPGTFLNFPEEGI